MALKDLLKTSVKLNKEPQCSWWFTGPAMEIHWKRFRWNLNPLNIFSNKTNPHANKPRTARRDITHSFVNIFFVEYCRECPYKAGHVLLYIIMLLIITNITTLYFLFF